MDLTIVEQNNQLLVDSREVAEMVEIEHKELLRKIEGTENGKYIGYIPTLTKGKIPPSDFFIKSNYIDRTGRNAKHYLLTKKGCDMVANKLTGEKGILFTATYVTKFEEMENKLKHVTLHSYMIEDPIARAEKWIEEQKERKRIETQKLMLEQQVKEYEPKVTYYDEILKSKTAMTITQIAKDYGMSGKAMNQLLHKEKVQYKQSGQWLLYSNHQDKGYTKSDTHLDKKGNAHMNTKWTQKGRLFIYDLLKRKDVLPVMEQNEK
ncbi:Rha family transcriptional regulator [Niallia circulans]|uniref:Rha family transcriptional regulator n=1 Tax=Niallia circulans TaxID=1397 RepID=A0AA91TWC3_NIACI|nr:phage regulatory protein/antirepressor Ant [Niallia circulans]PAD85054.1 Rha family transcriptional regulator [Niallia circulans]